MFFMFKTITHDLVFVEGCLMVVGWMYFYTCNDPFAAIQNEVTKDGRQVRAGIHTHGLWWLVVVVVTKWYFVFSHDFW